MKTTILTLTLLIVSSISFAQSDTIPPVILLNTQDTVCHPVGIRYTPVGVSVSDNETDSIDIVVTKQGIVDHNLLGLYLEVYTAFDLKNNKSSKTRYVLVKDTVPPLIRFNHPDTICHKVNTVYLPSQVYFTDNYYSPSMINLTEKGTVDPYTIGFYSIEYTATDLSGNTYSKTKYIIVSDTCPPTVGLDPDPNDISKVTIYPNPASSEVTLDNLKIGSEIEIYNLTGNLVVQIQSTSNNVTIQTDKLPMGPYLVLVKTSNEIKRSKLILSR